MALSIHGNCLCIPLQKELFVSTYDCHESSWENKQLIECSGGIHSTDDISIQSCSFSPCGRYCGVCMNKDIIIYNTKDWSCLCSTKTDRKGVSIKFFPKSDVVLLAEKSGNVKFFKFFENKMEKMDFVLGHNSMLIDALVTEDEKYIITCDRDEKIRVTNYPNIYNIQCYCLGHTEFICYIDFLPSDKNVLISSSGDGSIRLWKITTGEQLSQYEKRNPEADKNNCIIKIASLQTEKNESLIAALESASNHITILKVSGHFNSCIKIDLIYTIKQVPVPWDISFWQGKLICLVSNEENPLLIYNMNDYSVTAVESFKNLCDYLTLHWSSFLKAPKRSDIISLLFKYKKDDEMSCYQHEIKKTKLK